MLNCTQSCDTTGHENARAYTASGTKNDEEKANATDDIIVKEVAFLSHIINTVLVVNKSGLSLNNFEFCVITRTNLASMTKPLRQNVT